MLLFTVDSFLKTRVPLNGAFRFIAGSSLMVEFGLVALEGPSGHFLIILGVLLGSLLESLAASRGLKYSVFDDFYMRSAVFSCVFEVLGEAFSQVAPRGTL